AQYWYGGQLAAAERRTVARRVVLPRVAVDADAARPRPRRHSVLLNDAAADGADRLVDRLRRGGAHQRGAGVSGPRPLRGSGIWDLGSGVRDLEYGTPWRWISLGKTTPGGVDNFGQWAPPRSSIPDP